MKHIKLFENFNSFINESKSSDLYHWVSKIKMESIIDNNILYGNFIHTIKNVEFKGNSFSRNSKLKINYSYIRLTFNQLLLSYNYKIIPLDGEIIHRKINIKNDISSYQKYKDRNPKKYNVFGDSPIRKDFEKDRFDEEFILGDIKNVSKYIKHIEIFKPEWYSEEYDDNLINNIKEYSIKNKILFNNYNL